MKAHPGRDLRVRDLEQLDKFSIVREASRAVIRNESRRPKTWKDLSPNDRYF